LVTHTTRTTTSWPAAATQTTVTVRPSMLFSSGQTAVRLSGAEAANRVQCADHPCTPMYLTPDALSAKTVHISWLGDQLKISRLAYPCTVRQQINPMPNTKCFLTQHRHITALSENWPEYIRHSRCYFHRPLDIAGNIYCSEVVNKMYVPFGENEKKLENEGRRCRVGIQLTDSCNKHGPRHTSEEAKSI